MTAVPFWHRSRLISPPTLGIVAHMSGIFDLNEEINLDWSLQPIRPFGGVCSLERQSNFRRTEHDYRSV